jgi:ABC-type Fe3+ transport system permease subunit
MLFGIAVIYGVSIPGVILAFCFSRCEVPGDWEI